jgi:uncharacterized protein YuzE
MGGRSVWPLRKKAGTELSLPSGETVRVYLDKDVDAATIVLSDEPVARTVRVEGWGFVDLDADENVVAIELLRFSKQVVQVERQKKGRELDDELRASASRFVREARERVRTG